MMLLISILTSLLIITPTTAIPLSTSPSTTPTLLNTTAPPNITSILSTINTPPSPIVTDAFILNFLLTLSYLLRALYSTALTSLSHTDFLTAGFPDPFYASLKQIYLDEESHVWFLNKVLQAAGVEAERELEYVFPFGEGNVGGFVELAGVVVGVGVSAYLGALAQVDNKEYLTALSSILSVEAEHESFLREAIGEVPFPKPFGTPLGFNQTHTLAVGFITNFQDSVVKLPVVPFPSLTLACTSHYYQAGVSSVTFSGAFTNAEELGIMAETPVFAVFLSGLLKIPVRTRILNGEDYAVDRIPEGVVGQSYVLLSRSNDDFSDSNTIAGPAIIQVYRKDMIPNTPLPACPQSNVTKWEGVPSQGG
ncbi:hypothetical protein JMJ35_000731 [Cladonia borealis]|uniref:Uncharacterized protein n=1 Tax=Cladonia borealis TaxID=184061 RepID=A0AA39RAZ7_9LECA|nr:hypothetical protein JMJ35_000731 [Cladonia borealis]